MKNLKLLALLAALAVLAGCFNAVTEPNPSDGSQIPTNLSDTLVLGGNTDLLNIRGGLALPDAGADGSSITWTSSNPAVVSASGVVRRPPKGTGTTVTLTATITKNGKTVTKTFTISVQPVPADASMAITDDKATLVDSLIRGTNSNLATVNASLSLPTTGPSGTSIVWASDNPAVGCDGTVTRPAAGSLAATVTLTASFTKSGGTTVTSTFTVVVQPASADAGVAITDDKAALVACLIRGTNANLTTVTASLSLPTTGPSGTSIAWASDNPAIGPDGTVTRPAAGSPAAMVTLTATITKNGGTPVTNTFTVIVEPVPADASEAITEDQAAVVDSLIRGTNANLATVTASLSLPTTGPSGTSIVWASDNAAIGADGTVTRPAVGSPAITVTLTATITKNGGTPVTNTFTVIVQPQSVSPAVLGSTKAITGFSFTSPAATGTVTDATHTIAITVPTGTNVTGLAPGIVHTGASVSPDSGVAKDFTSPVIYTVTAADGSTQAYTVTVTIQAGAWTNYTTTNGLGDNIVRGVYVSGSNIYAATDNGLSVSTNAGVSWTNYTKVPNGLGANNVYGVYVYVLGSGSTIYAATSAGLSVSTTGGATWITKTTTDGLGNNGVRGVFISNFNSNGRIFAATNGGLTISNNRGASFYNYTTTNGLGNNTVQNVYLTESGSASTIYAATTSGLSISTDGGLHFTNTAPDGFASGTTPNAVNCVYVSGSTIYAGSAGGLSVSTDAGVNWTRYTTANGLGDNYVTAVYVSVSGSGSTIYAATMGGGVSVSTDGGTTWTNSTTANGLASNTVLGLTVVGTTIYAATAGGLSVSK